VLQSNKPECEQVLLLNCHFLGGFGSFEQGFPEDTLLKLTFSPLRMNAWKINFPIGKANFQRDMLVSGSVPIDTIF